MIRLTLIGKRSQTPAVVESPYFRITGGAVWTRPGNDPLLRYAGPTWHYDGAHWSGMRFDGKCRLVFGLPRDPAGVSELLSVVTIHACALSTNGIPFAVYEPSREMWRGATGGVWWHSFRLESLSLRPLEEDAGQRAKSIYVAVPPSRQQGPSSTH
jgi:hypothetical protein